MIFSEWTLIYSFRVVYVPPRFYSCCVLFSRPDGWSFNSSVCPSQLEMGKSHNTIWTEFVATSIQWADFKRICSWKLSYFPSLNSQQLVLHCIAMTTNASDINPRPKYFNLKYFNPKYLNFFGIFRINYIPSPAYLSFCGQKKQYHTKIP